MILIFIMDEIHMGHFQGEVPHMLCVLPADFIR